EGGAAGQDVGHLDHVDVPAVPEAAGPRVLLDQPHGVVGRRGVVHGRRPQAGTLEIALVHVQVGLGYPAGQVAHVDGADQDVVDIVDIRGAELVEGDDQGAAVEAQVAGEVGELVGLGGPDLVEVPVGRRQRRRVGRLGNGEVEHRAVVAGEVGPEH